MGWGLEEERIDFSTSIWHVYMDNVKLGISVVCLDGAKGDVRVMGRVVNRINKGGRVGRVEEGYSFGLGISLFFSYLRI